jgi:hypothetical protein
VQSYCRVSWWGKRCKTLFEDEGWEFEESVDAERIFHRAIIVPEYSVGFEVMPTLETNVFLFWGFGIPFVEVVPEVRRERRFHGGEM